MAANPSIVPRAVTGYVGNAGDTWLMCLYENKASLGYTQGVVKFLGGRHDIAANLCYPDEADALVYCINTTAYNLKGKVHILVRQGTFNFGCIQSFGCVSGDDCAGRTCAAFGSRISFETGIPIVAKQTSFTPAPTGLVITPGSGKLTISWNAVPDPTGLSEVFAYYVAVLSGGTPVVSGYTEAGLNQITIEGLTNGTAYSVEVRAVSHNEIQSNAVTGTGTPVGATNPQVFNFCWGTAITPPCSIPPQTPAVPAGTSFKIAADIANAGPNGKVRCVFKIDGSVISDQNSTLNTYPAGGFWSPTTTYTMPNRNVTLTVEAHGWDGSKWVLTQTVSTTISTSAPTCNQLSLDPFTATIKSGDKVTFTATAAPVTQAYTVKFKLRDGTVIGQCTTSTGTGKCTFIWDTTGKVSGLYYVTAYIEGQCQSLESSINISPPTRQWYVNIYVRDSSTNVPVDAANVTVGTQTKQTDISGYVQFRVDEGDVNISISKTGYNTFTTVELVYNDRTFNYALVPTGAVTGSVQFVSVPSGAEIFVDGTDQGVKTPYTVSGIPEGKHTFAFILAGYNDTTGEVTVVGGSVVQVYATLSPATPGTGSLSFYSTPLGAEMFIDGTDQNITTPQTITGLSPGSHALKLTLTGYQEWTGTVDIKAGETAYINPALTPLTTIGSLEINSTPQGARVFLDGKDQFKITPATITNLLPKVYDYKLTLSGYEDAIGKATVEAGKITVLNVPLKKTAPAAGAGMFIGISLLSLGIVGAVVVARRG